MGVTPKWKIPNKNGGFGGTPHFGKPPFRPLRPPWLLTGKANLFMGSFMSSKPVETQRTCSQPLNMGTEPSTKRTDRKRLLWIMSWVPQSVWCSLVKIGYFVIFKVSTWHPKVFGSHLYLGVSENVVYPIVPNGFADHYPYEKWLFHWEYTQHFQTNPFGTSIRSKTCDITTQDDQPGWRAWTACSRCSPCPWAAPR